MTPSDKYAWPTAPPPAGRCRGASVASAVAAWALLAACAPAEATHRWAEGDGCAVSLCINGAGRDDHPGNVVVEALCEELPGLLHACAGDSCRPTFEATDVAGAKDALVSVAADIEREMADPASCPISVFGYSYGGVTATEVSAQFLEDADVSDVMRRVDRLVLLDPYSPFANPPLDVPDVDRVWVHRHSEAPASDCSRESRIGPYEGLAPRCGEATECTDFDWSLSSDADEIGHCTITERARPAVLFSLQTGLHPQEAEAEIELPPTVSVERR